MYSNPEKLVKSLIREIKGSKAGNVIISSEECEPLKPDEITQLKDLIPDRYSIKIIYYVRRQDSRIESRYNQVMKIPHNSFHKTFYDFFRTDSFPVLDYYSFLIPWRESFGRENIIVRCYEKEQLADGIFADFLQTTGLNLDSAYNIPGEMINKSLNWDMIEYIRLCKARTTHDIDFNRYLVNKMKMVNLNYDDGKERRSLLSPDQKSHIIEYYSESNAKLAREYLGREDGRLFYAPLPDLSEPWEPYEGLTVEKIVPILTQMMYDIDPQK